MDDDIPEIRSSDFTLVELNRIRLLCEKRSFSKAAELAGVSQSALSQSIGLLEDRLGVTLFERTRRSVRPTQIAHYITSQAASILNAVQQIDDHIAEIKGATSGVLSVGFGIAPATFVLNEALGTFRQQLPGIQTHVLVDFPDILRDLLGRGDIEFLVATDLPHLRRADCTGETLYSYELKVIARPDHPLMGMESITFRDLISYPVIGFPPGFLLGRMLELLKNREEYEFVQHQFPAVETQQPFLFAELAAASDHVLLAHEPPLRHWIETGQLATARLEDLGETWDVQLIQRKDRKLSAAGIELAAAIREASGKYIG